MCGPAGRDWKESLAISEVTLRQKSLATGKQGKKSSDNRGGNPRFDRIEGILETIVLVQADMLAGTQEAVDCSNVLQGDELRQLAKRTDEKFQKLAEAQERMDTALTALMGTVDEIIQRPSA